MPVPSSINDLSTTPGSNSPAGSESPATFDDYMRTFAAFIAQLRDGKADSALAVLLSGAQTITGAKTFSVPIVGSVTGTAADLSATLSIAKGGTGVTDGSNLDQPGDIKATSRTTAPSGWLALPLVPTNVSRATYPALFAAYQADGFPWGAGDGSTTFGIPYMPANYVPVQANGNVGTATVGEVISHLHTVGQLGGSVSASSGPNFSALQTSSGINSGSTGGAANLAAGVRFLWCVKL